MTSRCSCSTLELNDKNSPQNCTGELPKIIWTCWFQGIKQMPLIVEECIGSWKRKNPDWEIIIVTLENASQYVPNISPFLIRKDISWTGKSDILRLYLLEKYGGVWCDSSVFCNKSLNEWLFKNISSGFFAFQRTDRYLLSSWFLAAVQNNLVISKWKSFVDWYLSINFRNNQTVNEQRPICASTPLGDKLTEWIDRKNISTSIWFSWLIRRILRISPYFWIHYAFEYLYRHNSKFKGIWDNTPKIHADMPHIIQEYGMFREDIDPQLWNNILSKKCPVYKLSWKTNNNVLTADCLVGRLFNIS